MDPNSRPPVHESLNVIATEDIYRNAEWRKSVVRYQFDEDNDHSEVAVYLWHNDDGWKRKNKYVIKTPEAWYTDKTIVEGLFSGAIDSLPDVDLPVSDYYTVGAGETVFRSDGWWKAILKIGQKGSYETEEVMIYLWQETDGEWRRRQKYTIKSEGRWFEEADVVESVLNVEGSESPASDPSPDSGSGAGSGTSTSPPDEFEQLSREIDKHLSESP